MRLVAGFAALVLLIAACGGGDDSLDDTEQAMADAIAVQMTEDGDSIATDEEAQCYGEGVVSEMGLDRLLELGLDQEAVESGTGPDDVELSDDDVDALLDPMMECIDFGAIFVEGLTSGADGEVSEESAECMADGISDDTIRSAAEAGLTGEEFDTATDQELLRDMIDLMSECLSPEEFQAVTGG